MRIRRSTSSLHRIALLALGVIVLLVQVGLSVHEEVAKHKDGARCEWCVQAVQFHAAVPATFALPPPPPAQIVSAVPLAVARGHAVPRAYFGRAPPSVSA